MATFDATTAECLVYSFHDGSVSKLACDLMHRVTKFELRVDDELRLIEAELDARSLRVECAMRDGAADKVGLSAGDKQKIDAHVAEHILRVDAFPRIRFFSVVAVRSDEGINIRGVLQLQNCSRPVSTLARLVHGRYQADLLIHQPSFGIKPFVSLLGTVRVKPDVLVRMRVPV